MQGPGSVYTARVLRGVELLQGKWKVHVLCAVNRGPIRLSELKRSLPLASKKALTASLRSLGAENVVMRRDLSTSVLHVEYEINPGVQKYLNELLDCLGQWSEQSLSAKGGGDGDDSTR